jgi:hypothetical protein
MNDGNDKMNGFSIMLACHLIRCGEFKLSRARCKMLLQKGLLFFNDKLVIKELISQQTEQNTTLS